jgi:hypothetical protein
MKHDDGSFFFPKHSGGLDGKASREWRGILNYASIVILAYHMNHLFFKHLFIHMLSGTSCLHSFSFRTSFRDTNDLIVVRNRLNPKQLHSFITCSQQITHLPSSLPFSSSTPTRPSPSRRPPSPPSPHSNFPISAADPAPPARRSARCRGSVSCPSARGSLARAPRT